MDLHYLFAGNFGYFCVLLPFNNFITDISGS